MLQDFHNHIAMLSLNHFKNLPKRGKPNVIKHEWTVLSCIIQENRLTNDFQVVALGTGSKCIGKAKMSSKGDILNDSHAEIICRRAFLRYVYEELKKRNGDVFKVDSNDCLLNSWIMFHFFTTHMPCGDAAIFSKQSSDEFGEIVQPLQTDYEEAETKRRKVVCGDIYRTGAKCLLQSTIQDAHSSGAEYHQLGAVRTKPGRGDPTLSLSCSDKLAKWCHVGIQGALLSLIVKNPICLSSFTVAGDTPFSKESLSRAIYGRLKVPHPYCINDIAIGQASIGFEFHKTDSRVPCPSSIIWCKTTMEPLQVAVDGLKQGVTKKDRTTRAARVTISKIELFRLFLETIDILRLPHLKELQKCEVYYDETKKKAVQYQRNISVLMDEGFKCWTLKNKNLEHFSMY
ncbi:hypothetical protein FQA39_LY17407 [Lamprigera yunnana]|nr:hypothetical protein FQA39_LY17407 [Lamprigera yunnana]